jgi:hypothetical protein
MPKELDDFLTQDCNGKFVDGTWLFGLLGSFKYTPTSEKVVTGFRYFACDAATVRAAFDAGDVAGLLKLPFALDEDGDADSSGVAVNLRYTASGSAVALQVEEHQNAQPVPVSEVRLYEGAEAQALLPVIKKLDQSA